MEDKLISTTEAARRLGVSLRRIHALIDAEKLPAAKWGRDWQIRDSDLRALEMRRKLNPDKGGRKPVDNPSPSALYKRQRREINKKSE